MTDLQDTTTRRLLIESFFLLIASLFVNFYAGVYATESASNSVTDIVLSNIRVYDFDEIFVYGSWILVAFIAFIIIRRLHKAPFAMKSIALFVIIRSVFITLTHIGPFPTQMVINPASFIRYFVFGGDLFFSGHTGLPFLMALVYWQEIWIRYTFIACSIFLGTVVLLAHLHYTIDVASAYFITYGIYHIARKVFKREYALFVARNEAEAQK